MKCDATVSKRWRLVPTKTLSGKAWIYFSNRLEHSETAWLNVVNAKRKLVSKHREKTMITADKTTNETILREAFRTMDAHQAQEIREAYYKAVEGLRTLADMLEVADANQPQTAGPLLNEHFYAIGAIEAMKDSLLGKIL
jgi:hypothetical protein